MTHSGSRGAEDPFKFKTGDHVGDGLIMIYIFKAGRIIRLTARAHYHGTDLKLQDLVLLAVVNGIGQTGLYALVALAAIAAVQTARRFRLTGRFLIAQFNFIEVLPTFFNR
jgi:hypothetical protein